MAQLDGHAIAILLEGQKLAVKVQADARCLARHCAQQWLQCVLRNQLIGLQRLAAVVHAGGLLLPVRHRGVGQMQDGWFGQLVDDEHIHRCLTRIAGIADALGKAEAAIDFHRARIATLHLGQLAGRCLLFHQHALHAASRQVDGQCQADRPGAHDQHRCRCPLLLLQALLLQIRPSLMLHTASSLRCPKPSL